MKVTAGSGHIYLSYNTWLGLGPEKTVATYHPNTGVLEVTEGTEGKLGIILRALRKTGQVKQSIIVRYW